MAISREVVMSLENNTPVKYANFRNILFTGKDERHVHLTDKLGNTKKVYIELFMKYGSILNKPVSNQSIN